MKILAIILIAILVIWCIGAILMYFERPNHDPFYQQAMGLLAGAEFYNIIHTQNKRLHLGTEAANHFYGVNVEEAQAILFHAAHYHFKMMKLDTTIEDVKEHIQKYTIPDFIDRLDTGEVATMSFGLFPSLYVAWIKKITALPDGTLDLDKIPYRHDMRQDAAKFLLENLNLPSYAEMERVTDTIPVDPIGVIHVMADWKNYVANDEREKA